MMTRQQTTDMRRQHAAAVQKAQQLRADNDQAQEKFAEWVVRNRNPFDEGQAEHIRIQAANAEMEQKRANLWLTHLRQLSPQQYTEGLQTGAVQRAYDNIWYH